VNPYMEQCQHCVMVGAPHTSNWDFIYFLAAFDIMKIPVKFTIKKEWMKFPVSLVMKPLGAVSIDRTPKEPGAEKISMVDAMAEMLIKNKNMAIVVTPEGTRKAVKKWKTGFYHVALKANVPIALGYMDYAKKEAGVGKIIYPTGDRIADLTEIVNFYKNVSAKFPEKNSVNQPGFSIE